jgi:acyl-CoA synthetase (AMP-forming)/AMP-acid ligase II
MLIQHFLEKSAARFPEKLAVIYKKKRVTFGEINLQADCLAALLAAHGVNRADRVIILLENSVEYVIAYYSILKVGAVAVPMSTNIKGEGFAQLVADLGPTAIISSKRFEAVLRNPNVDLSTVKLMVIDSPKHTWEMYPFSFVRFEDAVLTTMRPAKRRIQEKDLACIIFTSGSTGSPKGVMLSHRNIVANTLSICNYQNLNSKDIQMVVLPFFYVMGKSLLNTIVASGGTLVINNMFAFPAAVINQMIEEKVTVFSGVPSTYAYLLHRSPLKKSKARLSHLRLVTQAGGHMAKSLKMNLRDALPSQTKICIMYGATEASARLTWLDPAQFEQKIESIGKAIPNVQINILDPEGEKVTDGEIGEIVASGENIMAGYWRAPDETKAVLSENGYHTGDFGWMDPEGFIYVKGRKDDLLKVGGHRINPQEVEDALLATGLVVEATVVGLADDLLGKRLCAAVVPLDDSVSCDKIKKKVSIILPKYKIPSEFKTLKTIPKNASGKIDRSNCLKLLSTTQIV